MKHTPGLTQMLRPFQQRQRLMRIWQAAARALLITSSFVTVITLTASCFGFSWSPALPPLLAVVAAAIAALSVLLRTSTLRETARWLDQTLQLKDRLSSALQFQQEPDLTPVQQLQIADAHQQLARFTAEHVVPLVTPVDWKRGLALTAIATLLTVIGPFRWSGAAVGTAAGTTAVREGQRMQAELAPLEEAARESTDKDLQQTLQSMNRTLQELQTQPLPPEEAFAKLAEMENSLQQLQQKLNNPATMQQLKDIGEAMSAADELEDVGNLLSSGKLDQAAAELAKTQAPQLDRSERRAVAEKLQQLQQQFQQSATPQGSQKVADAAGRMSEGLQNQDAQKFEEAAEGLAFEAKRLAGQKKLSELLQQQMQSLAQARSEFESEAGNQAQGQGRGGNKAGKGSAGDPRGQQTAQSAAGSELRLTGEDSGTGAAETEKSEGQPQDQQAEREYRQNAQRYEALNEAALRSEPIPPGQKSLIRRYFQLIRPTQQPADTPATPR